MVPSSSSVSTLLAEALEEEQSLDSMASFGDLADSCSHTVGNSDNLALHVYSRLAKLHKHAMIPHLPRVMASVLSSLSVSPRLHQACSEVVSSLASHTIDPARNPTSNEEALRSLCRPLLSSLSCQNLFLSAGSASCLRALVESDPWRCAPLDLQELLCARGTMALELHLEQDQENMNYLSVSLLCLMTSLAELSSSIVIQGYGARLLRIAMDILQSSSSPSSSSWEKRAASAKLLESILKVVDSDLLDLDLSPIMGALEGHKMAGNNLSSPHYSPIKPLQPSRKHNISLFSGSNFHNRRTISPVSDTIHCHERNNSRPSAIVLHYTPQHESNFKSEPLYISSPPKEDCNHTVEDTQLKEKENEPLRLNAGRNRFCRRKKLQKYSKPMLNRKARMSGLLTSGNRQNGSVPNCSFGKNSICMMEVCPDDSDDDDDEDQFCLSTIDRCMLQSDEAKDGQNFNVFKEAKGPNENENEKLYSPGSDNCESGISSEHGSPEMNELLSEDMLSTPTEQIQRDDHASTSEWEEQGSVCSDLDPSCEHRHESPVSSGYEYSTIETVTQASDITPQAPDTASHMFQFSPDLHPGSRYARYYVKSQTSDQDSNPGSRYSRYSDEDDYVQVNSPISEASNQSLGRRYTKGSDTVSSHDSLIVGNSDMKSPLLTQTNPSTKADDSTINTTEVGSVVSVNCVIILRAPEQKSIIKSPPRTILGYLITLLRKAKICIELSFSLFIICIVALHLIEYLADGRELSLVPT